MKLWWGNIDTHANIMKKKGKKDNNEIQATCVKIDYKH